MEVSLDTVGAAENAANLGDDKHLIAPPNTILESPTSRSTSPKNPATGDVFELHAHEGSLQAALSVPVA
jgi:hypothetical protein